MNENLINPAFLYGESVFTTCLIENNQIHLWQEHFQQLLDNAMKYFFLSKFEFEKIQDEITQKVSEVNKEKKQVMRITVFERSKNEYAVQLNFRDFKPPNHSLKLKTFIRSQDPLMDSLKIGSYGKEFYLKKVAQTEGFDDCLFHNGNSIFESTTSNIFLIRENKLFTPSSGIYKGIIRQKILESNDVEVRDILLDELSTFDSVFLTNSVYNIQKVLKIDNKIFSNSDFSFSLGE